MTVKYTCTSEKVEQHVALTEQCSISALEVNFNAMRSIDSRFTYFTCLQNSGRAFQRAQLETSNAKKIGKCFFANYDI